jgi:hypothetical protein
VQPTEQCVQMFFLISVGAPTIFGPACALRTDPSGIKPKRGARARGQTGAAQERAAVENSRSKAGGDTLQTRPARGSISSLHQHVRGPINSG